MDGNQYQLQSILVWRAPQVLPHVEAVHELVDETERVSLGRVHSHEWRYVRLSLVEEGPHLNLITEPLVQLLAVKPTHDVVATHCDNLGDVERHVATIRLQHYVASAVCSFIDIRE